MAPRTDTLKRILTILEKWPIDETKTGRDLGTFLKNSFRKLQKTETFKDNRQKYWDRQYLSLQKIINSDHLKRYPRTLSSSATGLTAEQCNLVLSSEFLEQLKKEEESIFKKLFSLKTEQKDESPKTALDRDPYTQLHMQNLGNNFPGQLTPLLGRFSELPALLNNNGVQQNSIDGILFDFGCSSMQFDEADRGFSLSKDGPLDMRMDGNRFPDLPTAAEILAKANELDLARILKVYGEEKQAKKIARAIVEARYLFRNLNTTGELADLVDSVCNEQAIRVDKLHRKAHNATKTFQALRIFVNNELNEINYGLLLAHKYLKIGGRLVTISFHSLEDTIVKRHLMGNLIENIPNEVPLKYLNCSTSASKDVLEKVMEANWKCLHKHVILPTEEEVENNPRSRSAKLRAAVKLK
ncbi:s-adenosyl-methyltransferase mraw [Holotrichia oblita]|uniref:S-adenosyl-methyltransferase mraw n=1 Tax=Holotrichia oblita TaxID=644536 RepID=A0ACB9TQ43_HOLOL|nr:s-adenosyl-methyltransferase mraw [Holotrichia oblita]